MAVARPFQSERALLALVLTSILSIAGAQSLHAPDHPTSRYLGQIQAHTSEEVGSILQRLDVLLQQDADFPSSQPLALVLHGDEAYAFLRKNYAQNRALVDLAARLDAFNAIDIQICETWLKGAAAGKDELPAFVETVPYGPAREQQLLDEGYDYF